MNELKACVITIGNEILKGRTVNSNAAHIGKYLTNRGYEVERGLTVKDDPDEINWAISLVVGKYDLVVTTGGLGPTFDDMTVESVSRSLGLELIQDPETLDILQKRYRKLNTQVTPERIKLALIPKGSVPIKNRVGAAPGIFLRRRGTSILILPGVPSEMEAILCDSENLLSKSNRSYSEDIRHLKGIMESSMAPFVNSLMDKFDGKVYIKSHPLKSETNEPEIDLEVSAYADTKEEADRIVGEAVSMLMKKAEELRK